MPPSIILAKIMAETPTENLDQQIAKALPPLRLFHVLNPLNFSTTQKILLALILGLGVFWNAPALRNAPGPLVSNASASKEKTISKLTKATLLLPQEEMFSLFQSRHLFKGVDLPPPPAPRQEIVKKPGIAEKIKVLILCGVLQEDPIQAMIEVKDSGESHCVKAGETLLDMEVVSIAPGQVVLKYQDETAVLR